MMKNKYFILFFSFLYLLIGQKSFAQDYIENPNTTFSCIGCGIIDTTPYVTAIDVYIQTQPYVNPTYPTIQAVDITIHITYVSDDSQNTTHTEEQTASPDDETADLYWYLYYIYSQSSEENSGDGGGGGVGVTPPPIEEAPDWYRDLDNDDFHSAITKAFEYPGPGWKMGISSGLDCDSDTNQDYNNICEKLELEVIHQNNRKAITGQTLYLLDTTSDKSLNLKATASSASEIDWTNGLMWGTWEGYQSYYSNAKISAKAKFEYGYDTKFVNVEFVPFRDVTNTMTPYSLDLLKSTIENFKPLGADLGLSADVSYSRRDYNELAEDRFIKNKQEVAINASINGSGEVLVPGYSFDFKLVKGGVYAGLDASFGFSYTKKSYIKNDGLNQEVNENNEFKLDGGACFKGGVKLETDVQNNNFVNFNVSGSSVSCLEGSGEAREGKIILNLTGRPLTFVMVVKAKVNGVNLINYSRKVGFSDPVELIKDFEINLN